MYMYIYSGCQHKTKGPNFPSKAVGSKLIVKGVDPWGRIWLAPGLGRRAGGPAGKAGRRAGSDFKTSNAFVATPT